MLLFMLSPSSWLGREILAIKSRRVLASLTPWEHHFCLFLWVKDILLGTYLSEEGGTEECMCLWGTRQKFLFRGRILKQHSAEREWNVSDDVGYCWVQIVCFAAGMTASLFLTKRHKGEVESTNTPKNDWGINQYEGKGQQETCC